MGFYAGLLDSFAASRDHGRDYLASAAVPLPEHAIV
jgi:hypothetical protein